MCAALFLSTKYENIQKINVKYHIYIAIIVLSGSFRVV